MRGALPLFIAALTAIPATAATHRDPYQRANFVRENPCPATGRTRGACQGWQVDHVTPLKCGGADRPANMQWLTVADHKAKTKREARQCTKRRQRR